MIGDILLMLATSLDGFSAGIAYGYRRVKFPQRDRVLVAGLSIGAMGLAMLLGRAASALLPHRAGRLIGCLLLVGLGAWTILRELADGHAVREPHELWSWRIPRLGLVIQILHEPIEADLDDSGSINDIEAVWLGAALSLDAFAAGLAANLGISPPFYLPVLVGSANWLFLTGGIALGEHIEREKLPGLALLPGAILIILGLLRVL